MFKQESLQFLKVNFKQKRDEIFSELSQVGKIRGNGVLKITNMSNLTFLLYSYLFIYLIRYLFIQFYDYLFIYLFTHLFINLLIYDVLSIYWFSYKF